MEVTIQSQEPVNKSQFNHVKIIRVEDLSPRHSLFPQGDRKGPHPAPHRPRPYYELIITCSLLVSSKHPTLESYIFFEGASLLKRITSSPIPETSMEHGFG